MSDFSDLISEIGDATSELVENIGQAWRDLVEDIDSIGRARFVRGGGVCRCKAGGKKRYAIVATEGSVIAINKEGIAEIMDMTDFMKMYGADSIKVAGTDDMGLGDRHVLKKAFMLTDGKTYRSTREFVLECLGAEPNLRVDQALHDMFEDFDWLKFSPVEDDDEDLGKDEEEDSESKTEDGE
ncbi:MAG: hypothetical protein MJ025_01605 [Victivallaceae bacterium]|nr:hypothetical protein [Victivallaceae bacterium]